MLLAKIPRIVLKGYFLIHLEMSDIYKDYQKPAITVV